MKKRDMEKKDRKEGRKKERKKASKQAWNSSVGEIYNYVDPK